MKTIFPIFLFLITSCIATAQEEQTIIYSENTPCIYSQVANIRQGVGTSSPITDKLFLGDNVEIVEYEHDPADNADVYNWAKISYKKGGISKEGYTHYQNLAFTKLTKEDIMFLIKTESDNSTIEEDYGMGRLVTYKVKAIKKNKAIAECEFKGKIISGIYAWIGTESKLPSNEEKLTNVENILNIYSPGEACAIPSFYYYLAWTGTEILPIMNSWGAGDDSFIEAEEVIFPGNNVPANIILKLYLNGEGEDGNIETNVYYMEAYKWNGKKAVLLKQSKDKKQE